MTEIDLMADYPKTDRSDQLAVREAVPEHERRQLRKFGREYFDGTRRQGLGGYHYNKKFFGPVVRRMIDYYGLTNESSVLDVGCAKGFMLYDFKQALPGIRVAGIDISSYCVREEALPQVRSRLQLASCDHLPYRDKSFDLVVSIATIHNLLPAGVRKSLREIERVSRKHAFIKINGHHNEQERIDFEKWNIVAQTSLSAEEWKIMFEEEGFTGDYAWFKA